MCVQTVKVGKAWSETSREVDAGGGGGGGGGTSLPVAHVHIVLVQPKLGFSCAAHIMGSLDKAIINFLK